MTKPAVILSFLPHRCIDPSKRGLIPLYETGMACPGCRRRAWIVGRMSAECGNCGTALELAGSRGRG